jgi:hypothetical protein
VTAQGIRVIDHGQHRMAVQGRNEGIDGRNKWVQLIQRNPGTAVSPRTIVRIETYRLLSSHAVVYLVFPEITR